MTIEDEDFLKRDPVTQRDLFLKEFALAETLVTDTTKDILIRTR